MSTPTHHVHLRTLLVPDKGSVFLKEQRVHIIAIILEHILSQIYIQAEVQEILLSMAGDISGKTSENSVFEGSDESMPTLF